MIPIIIGIGLRENCILSFPPLLSLSPLFSSPIKEKYKNSDSITDRNVADYLNISPQQHMKYFVRRLVNDFPGLPISYQYLKG